MLNIKLLAIIVIIIAPLLNQAKAQESITITTPTGMYVPAVGKKIIIEAYKKMDIGITFKEQSGERAIINAENGMSDGVLNRISGIESEYKNLLMVPIPINSISFGVFTKNVDFPVTGWESLAPYSIVIRRGIKAVENQIPDNLKYNTVTTGKQVFLMIERDRVDVGIYSLDEGAYIINSLGLKHIKLLPSPLYSVNLYHYLHKRHRILIPKLTKILKEMESNGDIKRIKEQVHKEITL